MMLPIYIDIDGTLTTEDRPHAPVVESRLATVRRMIDMITGPEVVIWSARGKDYVEDFVKKNNLTGAICMGKPSLIVDDNPDIRPRKSMMIMSPEEYFL